MVKARNLSFYSNVFYSISFTLTCLHFLNWHTIVHFKKAKFYLLQEKAISEGLFLIFGHKTSLLDRRLIFHENNFFKIISGFNWSRIKKCLKSSILLIVKFYWWLLLTICFICSLKSTDLNLTVEILLSRMQYVYGRSIF